MKTFNNFTLSFLFAFLLISCESKACSLEILIDKLIEDKNCSTLIVEGDKTPPLPIYAYNSLDLNEISKAIPTLSFDWKEEAPCSLHEKFSCVELKNFTSDNLSHKYCIPNAFNCLKSNGKLEFDCTVEVLQLGQNYAFLNPFEIIALEPFQDKKLDKIRKKISKQELEKIEAKQKFYKLTGYAEDQKFTFDELTSKVKQTPEIEDTYLAYIKTKRNIKELQKKLPVNEVQAKLNLARNQIQAYLENSGFKNIEFMALHAFGSTQSKAYRVKATRPSAN